MNDITPPDRRSIRNVSLPRRRVEPTIITRKPELVRPIRDEGLYQPAFDGTLDRPEKVRRGPRIIVWGISVVSVLVLGFIVSSLFTRAALTVTLKPEPITVPNLVVQANLVQGTTTSLIYVPREAAVSKSITLTGTSTETVNIKSTGKLIIYNKTNSPQILVKTTRFETVSRRIYRLDNQVTVPAQKGTVAGSIEASVTADQPGDTYNMGLEDFTIPGFKDSPRYTQFYARSKTPMAGGFTGTRPKVIAQALVAARKTLTEQVLADTPDVDAAQYIVLSGLATTSVTFAEKADGQTMMLTATGNTTHFAITKESLAAYIQSNSTTTRRVLDTRKLAASRVAMRPNGAIEFILSGTAVLVTDLDQARFIQAVAGKKQKDLNAVFAQFPNIAEAHAVIRPFWKSTVPTRTSLISVTVNSPVLDSE